MNRGSMRKLLAVFILALPLAVHASVVYSFSEAFPRGTIGFTYNSPDYLTGSVIRIPGDQFSSCDTSFLTG